MRTRPMLRVTTFAGLVGVVVLASIGLGARDAEAGTHAVRANTTLAGSGFVRVEGTSFVLDGKPFVMKGFNYFPRDYGWTSMTTWDWAAVDRELGLASSLGSNTLRTGINFLYATGNTWEERPPDEAYAVTPAYLAAIDRLLALADTHGMKVILWVADCMPAELWRPERFDLFERHLETLVPRYANDPRIAAWDLYTDLDPSMLAPVAEGGWGVPWATRDAMVDLLRREAAVFRRLDPNHPLGVGFSWPSSSLLVQDFTDFLMPQFLGGDHPEILTGSSLGPVAAYGSLDGALGHRAVTIASLQAKVQELRRQLHRPMPILLSEFGMPSGGDSSSVLQAAVYDAVCEVAFKREQLAGALAWALTDFRWPPLGETNVPADAAQSTEAERTFGVFDLAYKPKPAAEVARRWFTASSQKATVSGTST